MPAHSTVTSVELSVMELDELGALLRLAAYHGEEIRCMLPSEIRDVLMTAVSFVSRPPTINEGFVIVTSHWNAVGDLSPASQERLTEVLSHATYRAERLGVEYWGAEFDEIICGKFIHSMTSVLGEPSTSTMHLRRSALRAGFATLRQLGLFRGDPTLDIKLPPRSQLAARAAVDDEIALLRMHAVTSRRSRQPATLALAEATAGTSEIAQVRLGDVHVGGDGEIGVVDLPGGKGVKPRQGQLSPWGSRVMRSWIEWRCDQGALEGDPLVYFGDLPGKDSPQVSACRALGSIFRRAGLNGEPDLSPRSITFWAGRLAFDSARTAKLETAAKSMGIASLDRAAQRIDYTWETA